MATYTNNFSLGEPGYGDKADIGFLNQQVTEKVDYWMEKNRGNIAPAYDPTETYNTGDPAYGPDDLLYKCKEDNVTGTWDSTKWEETTAAEMGGGGGANVVANPSGSATSALEKLKVDNTIYSVPKNINDLGDVTMTSPTEGQVPTYDATAQKWKNKDLPAVTKKVSGNPVTFTDGADAPLVECKAEIVATQDLHGYDKPWVGGAGSNKWDEIYTDLSEQIIRYKAVNVGSGTFTFSTDMPMNDTRAANLFFLAGNVSTGASTAANGVYINREITVDAIDGYVTVAYRAAGNKDPNNYHAMLNSGSTATTYSPYSNICPISGYSEVEIDGCGTNQWDEEWVQGQYDTTTGQPTSSTNRIRNKYPIKVTPSTTYRAVCRNLAIRVLYYDENNNYISNETVNNTVFTTPSNAQYICFHSSASYGTTYNNDIAINYPSSVTTYEPYTPNSYEIDLGSTRYGGEVDAPRGDMEVTWGYYASYNGETLPGRWISDRDEYVAGTTPTIGAEVAYELASPVTVSLTPTAIRSLLGNNYMSCNSGELEITYITQDYQPLIDIIGSGGSSSGHEYSTNEHEVGKWIDDSTLYEMTLNKTISAGTAVQTLFNSSDLPGVVQIVDIQGYYKEPNYLNTIPLNLYRSSNNWSCLYVDDQQVINGFCKWSTNSTMQLYLTIRYTKVTPSRSIRSIEEPTEEPTEEQR